MENIYEAEFKRYEYHPMGAVALDLQNRGEILYANRVFCSLLGSNSHCLIGSEIIALVCPEQAVTVFRGDCPYPQFSSENAGKPIHLSFSKTGTRALIFFDKQSILVNERDVCFFLVKQAWPTPLTLSFLVKPLYASDLTLFLVKHPKLVGLILGVLLGLVKGGDVLTAVEEISKFLLTTPK